MGGYCAWGPKVITNMAAPPVVCLANNGLCYKTERPISLTRTNMIIKLWQMLKLLIDIYMAIYTFWVEFLLKKQTKKKTNVAIGQAVGYNCKNKIGCPFWISSFCNVPDIVDVHSQWRDLYSLIILPVMWKRIYLRLCTSPHKHDFSLGRWHYTCVLLLLHRVNDNALETC